MTPRVQLLINGWTALPRRGRCRWHHSWCSPPPILLQNIKNTFGLKAVPPDLQSRSFPRSPPKNFHFTFILERNGSLSEPRMFCHNSLR